MNENELTSYWSEARRQIIIAQLGPIFLLTLTVAFLQLGLADTPLAVRLAAAGILLATGVLGAVAQIAAANEGAAVAQDLATLGTTSALGRSIVASAPWINVVRIGTPALFTVIFVVLLVALFIPGAA
ncbi:MAG: hypothetical protein H7146_08485 [Burkholderiaceae bacterium]|nr:hypothetical protein [Microbacteriaceae bacterium]